MKTYQEMVQEYKRRQRNTVVDTIAAGLTYMDEIALDTGLLEETGLLTELTETACGALPFAIIAVTEGSKVVLGKKTGKSGVKDGAFRMAKTGAAMGIGSAVTMAAFPPSECPTSAKSPMFSERRCAASASARSS